VTALEGKVLPGAGTADNGQLTLFSAMIHGTGVTLAQIWVPEGTNEITQLDTVLAGVPVGTPERVIVTFDAAHTQRDTAEHLRGELGFDDVMTVKVNQPTLQGNVFTKCLPLLATAPGHVVEERAHGRINGGRPGPPTPTESSSPTPPNSAASAETSWAWMEPSHVLVEDLLPDSGVSRLGTIIVGDAHPRTRCFEALGDADEHVVGHHPTALEDLGYLGLGLPGQLRDLSLTDASLGEQPVDGGDVALG
jgi:hypothetical protein